MRAPPNELGWMKPAEDPLIEAVRLRLAPLARRSEVLMIVLFGSRATGRARADSDTDLGVLVDREFPHDLDEAVMRLLGTGHIDLVDLRRAPPLLAMEIVRKGQCLYQARPGVFADFASLTLRRFADTEKFRVLARRGLHSYLASKGL